MFSWWKKKPEPESDLKPLPLSQREKSYSAATGAVYQYLFRGMAGSSHVFGVTADRQAPFDVRIELGQTGLAACAERMGSTLRWNEEYALAKLCLFAAFDSVEDPAQLRELIRPAAAELLEHMNTLKMAH